MTGLPGKEECMETGRILEIRVTAHIFFPFMENRVFFFCTHIILIAFVLSLLLPGLPLLPSYLLLPPF